ncbi:hypothetical protein [Agromyces larvae]|uniref:Uncharacterized protein n=1 Tax=Agromyces larvae TaxID=2929802 RepID=A0ABY4C1Q7_9MICO|nr:hypothetical protein [Agromyces larvae]UOE44954.1 hypothetical protein MTO99_04010 [Agromyces larvae]
MAVGDRGTHVVTSNGTSRGELLDWFRSYREQLHRHLSLLDGKKRFALELGALPRGKNWLDLGADYAPPEYIQCAGSADRMAIEVREIGPDGVAHQYAIGRGGDRSGDPSETIQYAEHQVMVYPDEVFGLHEATGLFYAYFQDGTIPASYARRELSL